MVNFIRLAFFFNVFFVFAQSPDQNYTLSVAPKEPVSVENFESNFIPTPENSIVNIVYRDGFGKSIQLINKGATPSGQDIINYIYYDQFGREARQYFPFPGLEATGNYVANAKDQQQAYYLEKYNDNTPYKEDLLENSPLNRVKESSAGGDVWKAIDGVDTDKTTKYSYELNTAFDVKLLTLDASRVLNNASYYQAHTLIKTVIKNENWVTADNEINTQQIYTNKSGKKIAEVTFSKDNNFLQRHVKQFVYDSRGLLKYALTPKASLHDFQAYNTANNTLVWDYRLFLNTNFVGGSGTVTATINNGVVTLNMNATFTTAGLKIGQVVYIDDRIPDSTPTVISCPGCGTSYSTGYLVYMRQGFLCISSSNPTLTTGFNLTVNYNAGTNLTSFFTNQQILDQYAYQYKYDQYSRPVERKDPGKAWEYIIYDSLDRPILTQDGNLRSLGKWLFTKYDPLGRVLYTGYYNSTQSREALQGIADNYIASNTSNPSNCEYRTSGATNILGLPFQYSNNAFPNSTDILTLNYYDDYNFQDPSLPSNPLIVEEQAVTQNTKGLITASYAKTLSGGVVWNKRYTYYDAEGRSIFDYEGNIQGGYTIVETKYDYRGKVIQTRTKHKRATTQAAPELVIVDSYAYDNSERLIGQYQKINNQSEEAIAVIDYDDLGAMTSKSVGGLARLGIALQKVSYTYNIRNWLTAINNHQNLGNSLFGYSINYSDPIAAPGYAPAIVPKYNGNIAQIQWKTKADEANLNGYQYYYDENGRMKSAYFTGTQNSSAIGNAFTESATYDINGNIRSLDRYSLVNNATTLIDKMAYSYEGNQLKKIEDVFDTYGFSDGTTSGSSLNDYEYDSNGNLIRDRNKGIENIIYNHLDLVQNVQYTNGNLLHFRYDAQGNKLSKTYSVIGNPAVITEYFGEFQYLNSDLQFFPTAEGFVSKSTVGGNDTYTYVYSYRDHLGNTRVNYKGAINPVISETFETGTLGFTGIGTGGGASNLSGRLRISATNANSGAQKLLISNVVSGTRISIRALIDNAVTNKVRVSVIMQYSGGFSEESVLSDNAVGQFSAEIVAPGALSNVYLKFSKSAFSSDTGLGTYFFVDDLFVKQVELTTLSATHYYPYGLVHSGEFISGEAAANNYKFQGKEWQNESNFGTYDFGARMYDPAVGRWFSTDPQNQFDSSYLAFANNPVTRIDPTGEVVPVIVAGAILGAFVGASTYAMMSFQTNSWSWKDFGKSVAKGAIIGAISAGISGSAVLTAQSIGESVASGMFTAMAPGKTFKISNNLSLSISPALITGNATGVGVNATATYSEGDYHISAGYGYASYSDYNGFSSGTEHRISGMVGYDDGKTGVSMGTNIWRGDVGAQAYTESFSQRTGVIGLHFGDFKAMYENDGGLGIRQLRLGDRGDSYRTAALNVSVGDYTAGFNLFTGYRDVDSLKEKTQKNGSDAFPVVNAKDSYGRSYKRSFVDEKGPKFRLGVLTFGYRGYRVGVNSEHVRHAIQDVVIHGMIEDAGFENQSWDWKFYFQKRTPNMFSTW